MWVSQGSQGAGGGLCVSDSETVYMIGCRGWLCVSETVYDCMIARV